MKNFNNSIPPHNVKGKIFFIDLPQKWPITRDICLMRKVDTLEKGKHIDGGLVVPDSHPLRATLKYCNNKEIEVFQTLLKDLEQIQQFYCFLKEGIYLQTRETINPILYTYTKELIERSEFEFYEII